MPKGRELQGRKTEASDRMSAKDVGRHEGGGKNPSKGVSVKEVQCLREGRVPSGRSWCRREGAPSGEKDHHPH